MILFNNVFFSFLDKSENTLPENCTQTSNFKSTSSVDSLVVNFEEGMQLVKSFNYI